MNRRAVCTASCGSLIGGPYSVVALGAGAIAGPGEEATLAPSRELMNTTSPAMRTITDTVVKTTRTSDRSHS